MLAAAAGYGRRVARGGDECCRVERWSGRPRGNGRDWLGNPHTVGLGGDEFGDSVSEGRERSDVEDGEGVLSFIHASGGQDDGDEVDTGVSEERE